MEVEGIEFDIDWDSFSVGASVFIPTVATDKVIGIVHAAANRRNLRVVCKVGERGGYWGVGIWRVG